MDNGNTIRDAGDRYGLTFGDLNKYYGMTAGLGMQAFTKDETGYEFILDNERNVTAFQRPVEFINGNENVLASKESHGNEGFSISSGGSNYVSQQFVDGNSPSLRV